jgi:predicted metal-dependent enzyme (double-stranded beta helix superfamily)
MSLEPLRALVSGFALLLARNPDEPEILKTGGRLLGALVARDSWLPEAFAQVGERGYAQHLLHCDSAERFSVVSFAWAPGASTPVHDHTVWGLIGVLRGAELSQPFAITAEGLAQTGSARRLGPGEVEAVSPGIGDIHKVTNAFADEVSVSIHVYGGNIGAVRRHIFEPDGLTRLFVSGYSNAEVPNIWREEVA